MIRVILLGCFVCLFTHLSARDLSSVLGKVNTSAGRPLPGVIVRIAGLEGSTQTDTQGRYRFDSIAAGSYLISLARPGYSTLVTRIHVASDSAGPQEIATVVLQEDLTSLGEVIVSAEKREQLNTQIPASVTILDAAAVNDFRVWNVAELTGIVPSLYAADPGDNRSVISIRGITTTSYDPAVALYVDGVSQFGLDTYIGELLEPERIEVLRGPQSTLYGRNTSGGVINIVTRQPSLRKSAFAELNAGNYGQQRYKAGFTTPLGRRLHFGAAGMWSGNEGFYTNTFDGSRYDRQHIVSGAYFLKWSSLNRRWRLSLDVKHQLVQNRGAFPLVFGADEALQHPFELSQNAVAAMNDRTWNASAALRYSGRGFELHSQTAWQTNRRIYNGPLDGDFSSADAISIENDFGGDWNRVRVLTQELRISSPAQRSDKDLTWVAGTYLFEQRSPVKQATIFGRDAALTGSPDSLYRIVNTSAAVNSGLAFFGQLSIPLGARLKLTGGLRYDYQRSRLALRSDYVSDKGDPGFAIQDDTSGKTKFDALSPKAALLYQLNERSSLFTAYSRGFRTGGLTQLGTDPSQPALSPFNPEYSNNFEAGVKSTLWHDRLRLGVTGFYISVTDVQIPSLVLPEAYTITKNTGAMRSYGAEAELQALLLSGLRLQYSFGYTDARYTALRLPANGVEQDFGGNRQIFTPGYTSMLALQYQRPLSQRRRMDLVLRGEWLELGRQYFDAANTIAQAPYRLFNARAALRLPAAEFALWMRNAGDVRYIDYAYDFGAVHLGNPRTYGATMALRLN
jgi:iron complex outermembrane receptor protein